MTTIPPSAHVLMDFKPQRSCFVGVDSDGCAFDVMELKQKECFIPITIGVWGLQPISKYARETAEWVNLYSKWRGANRWPALVKVFDPTVGVDPIGEHRRVDSLELTLTDHPVVLLLAGSAADRRAD